jgi:hypothetical protein
LFESDYDQGGFIRFKEATRPLGQSEKNLFRRRRRKADRLKRSQPSTESLNLLGKESRGEAHHVHFLSLACQTCADLLTVGKLAATQSIVHVAMSFMHINPMKIPLLTLVSRANFQVDELPLRDPVIARCFPGLHAKLSSIASADRREEVG